MQYVRHVKSFEPRANRGAGYLLVAHLLFHRRVVLGKVEVVAGDVGGTVHPRMQGQLHLHNLCLIVDSDVVAVWVELF